MKLKITLLLFAFTFFCQAQTITFTDANFKAKLLEASGSNTIAKNMLGSYFKIDSNNDNEIQVSEALEVSYLAVAGSSIVSLAEISYFTNVFFLQCGNNQIVNLNLAGLTNLQTLYCNNNLISTLNLSNFSSLNTLYCNNNQITTLSLNGCTYLSTLICNNNLLTSLVTTGLNSLSTIWCHFNQLSTLSVINLSSLQNLYCYNNFISSLTTTNCPYLLDLRCNNNQLFTINTASLLNLQILYCNNNQLTELNLNSNRSLNYLNCASNLIESIFIKIGRTITTFIFNNNPNLRYICCDESRISSINSQTFQNGYPFNTVEVNSYCSFVPGGTFYTIQGSNKYDSDNTGCDSNDIIYPNLKSTINNGTITGTLIANATGNFSIGLQNGNYTITPIFENPSYYNVSPSSLLLTFPGATSPNNQNFCITSNGNHNDLEVVLIPTSSARPGFNSSYTLIYKNKGTQTVSGQVTLEYGANPGVMELVSALPAITSNVGYVLSWDYFNLQPFETRIITVVMNLNSPSESPPLVGGDDLGLASRVYPIVGDEYFQDNYSDLKQRVVNAFDPNDKTCVEGDVVGPSIIGNYAHYVIRFENTGTANATNIVVKDVIDTTKFDLATLVPLHGSHAFTTRINGNIVEFIFENINLPFDNANNDGYVAFKIKTKSTLVIGNTFSNLANIYFDYNFPIVTNNFTTTIQVLNINELDAKNLGIYPNPVKDFIHFNSDSNVTKVEIFDQLGRIINSIGVTDSKVDLSQLQTGNYILKVYTQNKIITTKIVKL